jgi:hypothetical protein
VRNRCQGIRLIGYAGPGPNVPPRAVMHDMVPNAPTHSPLEPDRVPHGPVVTNAVPASAYMIVRPYRVPVRVHDGAPIG